MEKNILNRSVLLIFSLSFFLSIQGFSQGTAAYDTSNSFVKEDLKIDKFYKEKELEEMPKLDLINIYKDRLEYLIEVLPFMSLHPKPGATFHDMAIPETENNIEHLDKETQNKREFISSLFDTLDDVVPYSEKDHIIWSILFFDKMIQESNYVE